MTIYFQIRIWRFGLNVGYYKPTATKAPTTNATVNKNPCDRNKKTAEGDASAVKVEVTNVIQN